jgi:hypothetical protein
MRTYLSGEVSRFGIPQASRAERTDDQNVNLTESFNFSALKVLCPRHLNDIMSSKAPLSELC